MVKHIVVWKLKPSAEGADRVVNAERGKSALEGLRGKIPGMSHIEVGINFNSTDAAYDVALYSEFESREALNVYQDHPEHVRVKSFIKRVRDVRVVVDYEV
jgi:hypothetical protein